MAPASDLVWKALADPTRRAIVDLLRDQPRTTGDLAESFPTLTRFGVMKHLGVLEQAELVVVRRRGRERWNYLNGVPLRSAYERWMRPYADQWADSLLRLTDTVERPEKGSIMSTTTNALPLATLDIAQETRVAAPREKVFDALCKMGDWWPHRYQEQSQVHFEATVGGRFWEEWVGGGALYATVDQIRRPELLECTGPMGISGPVLGVFTLTLEEDGQETVLKLTHRAYGDIDEETRIGYTEGWGAIINVLKSYLGLAG